MYQIKMVHKKIVKRKTLTRMLTAQLLTNVDRRPDAGQRESSLIVANIYVDPYLPTPRRRSTDSPPQIYRLD